MSLQPPFVADDKAVARPSVRRAQIRSGCGRGAQAILGETPLDRPGMSLASSLVRQVVAAFVADRKKSGTTASKAMIAITIMAWPIPNRSPSKPKA